MRLATVNADKLAVLKHLAASGDIVAQELVNSISNETALAALGTGLVSGGAPAAKNATVVQGTSYGDAGSNVIAGPFTAPVAPRNLMMTFGAAWDGGNIVVEGTDQFGAAVTETFLSNTGSTRVGTKVFKTVTAVSKTAIGVGSHATNTLTIGTGDKIGLTVLALAASPVLLFVDGVAEAVTFDFTYNAFTPTTLPNGTRAYVLAFNL